MWPFSLFRRKTKQPLYPECLWSVELDHAFIRGTDHTGVFMAIDRSDLGKVAIETNDSGPWGADVYWLLFRKSGELALAYPQGASGEQPVLDYLMALPGFDEREMIKAMGSTNNALFIVWESSETQE